MFVAVCVSSAVSEIQLYMSCSPIPTSERRLYMSGSRTTPSVINSSLRNSIVYVLLTNTNLRNTTLYVLLTYHPFSHQGCTTGSFAAPTFSLAHMDSTVTENNSPGDTFLSALKNLPKLPDAFVLQLNSARLASHVVHLFSDTDHAEILCRFAKYVYEVLRVFAQVPLFRTS
ncbi:hypothetical protein EDD18DRAFT_1152715 [Armillaria luteobubalina]|uniref:Uncharacterized protein n=1 Tax=Armillaria luteobubalina TaxID=153913 RepID=A0AA39QCK5_9AGAR|nr:hypothetical protein EDD18DRAFT_1152715 [Armillaria luteobubalina]